MSGKPLEQVLHASFDLAPCSVVIVDDSPEAIFGCAEANGLGIPWMLASDKAFYDKAHFIRTSIAIVNGWCRRHRVLFNYVHQDNHIARKWLRKLGFVFLQKREFSGEPFIEFTRIGNV